MIVSIELKQNFVSYQTRLKMSDILQKFDVFSEVSDELKQKVKLFHVFEDVNGKNVLFITNEDKVFLSVIIIGENVVLDIQREFSSQQLFRNCVENKSNNSLLDMILFWG